MVGQSRVRIPQQVGHHARAAHRGQGLRIALAPPQEQQQQRQTHVPRLHALLVWAGLKRRRASTPLTAQQACDRHAGTGKDQSCRAGISMQVNSAM